MIGSDFETTVTLRVRAHSFVLSDTYHRSDNRTPVVSIENSARQWRCRGVSPNKAPLLQTADNYQQRE
jgi:hypothetical protein